MSFLAARFNQLKVKLGEQDLFNKYIVSDYIFAKCLLFSKVNLDEDEYDLYYKLFKIINLQLRQPDLLVYLHSPVEKLLWNINNRGRSYEKNISQNYLLNLQEAYFSYFQANSNLRTLVVDCSDFDFIKKPEDYFKIKEIILKDYPKGVNFIRL